MNFIYKTATQQDIDILVTTRIKVLRAANKLADQVDMSEVAAQSRDYYEKALKDGSHTAILVYDKDRRGRYQLFQGHADLSQPDRKESLYYEYVYKSSIPAKRDCIPDAEFTGGGCKEQRN